MTSSREALKPYCGYTPVYTARGIVTWNDKTAAGVAGAGVAGVYTCDVIIPANSYILDEVVHGVALWNAGTTATGIVGDVTDPNGTYTAINLKATDLLAGESISVALAGGKAGDDIAGSQFNRRYSTSERTITLEVTLVGTAATTGESHLEVIYTHYPPQEYGSTGLFVAT